MAQEILPVSIDGIEFSALMELSATLTADTPAYATESGYSVSDHTQIRPLELSMIVMLSPTPVTHRIRHGFGQAMVDYARKRLEDLFFSKTPVTVITNDKTYENMAIISIVLSKTSDSGSAMEIPISFQQVNVAESMTVTIPDSYGRSGTTGVNAGMANVTNAAAGSDEEGNDNRTLLRSLTDWTGATSFVASGDIGGAGSKFVTGLVSGLIGGVGA